jgi:hypothetical protein
MFISGKACTVSFPIRPFMSSDTSFEGIRPVAGGYPRETLDFPNLFFFLIYLEHPYIPKNLTRLGGIDVQSLVRVARNASPVLVG